MSNDKEWQDHFKQYPQAPTPPQGTIDNDERIRIETIKQTVTGGQQSTKGQTGSKASGGQSGNGS